MCCIWPTKFDRLRVRYAGEGKKKRVGIGFGVRVATSILAVVLAIEFPAYFHEIAVMASLVTGQFLLLIIGIIFALQEK